MNADQKLLFQLTAEGDEKAFSALFNLFLPKLYPSIIKLTKWREISAEAPWGFSGPAAPRIRCCCDKAHWARSYILRALAIRVI